MTMIRGASATRVKRREIYEKEISACSLFGAMNRNGERFTGEGVISAIANMHVEETVLAVDSQYTGFIRSIKTIMHFILCLKEGMRKQRKKPMHS